MCQPAISDIKPQAQLHGFHYPPRPRLAEGGVLYYEDIWQCPIVHPVSQYDEITFGATTGDVCLSPVLFTNLRSLEES